MIINATSGHFEEETVDNLIKLRILENNPRNKSVQLPLEEQLNLTEEETERRRLKRHIDKVRRSLIEAKFEKEESGESQRDEIPGENDFNWWDLPIGKLTENELSIASTSNISRPSIPSISLTIDSIEEDEFAGENREDREYIAIVKNLIDQADAKLNDEANEEKENSIKSKEGSVFSFSEAESGKSGKFSETEFGKSTSVYVAGEDTKIYPEYLDLTAHGLLNESILEQFPHVKKIKLSSNFLESMDYGPMPYLTEIDVSDNILKKFIELFPPLSLQVADFSYNRISEICDLSPFWSLVEINLSHNKITILKGFNNLKYLKILILSHNKISSIEEFNCPNLIVLILCKNELENTSISMFSKCPNLRYLNLSRNKISNLSDLRFLYKLTHLRLNNNNISNLAEIDNLKCLLNLRYLWIGENPLADIKFCRLAVIHSIPQLLFLEGKKLQGKEKSKAKNYFDPTYEEISFRDHLGILLDRGAQSGDLIFDEFKTIHPFMPPILLLVGPSKSEKNKLALFLKEKFGNKIEIGGLHTTASTIEESKADIDIPVTIEVFEEMKLNGDFLCTNSHLGRISGFAAYQISKAAEKGSMLVSSVNLITALCLVKWNLRLTTLLVIPSKSPHFTLDDREKTIDAPDPLPLSKSFHHPSSKRHVSFGEGEDTKKNRRKSDPNHPILREPSFEKYMATKSEKEFWAKKEPRNVKSSASSLTMTVTPRTPETSETDNFLREFKCNQNLSNSEFSIESEFYDEDEGSFKVQLRSLIETNIEYINDLTLEEQELQKLQKKEEVDHRFRNRDAMVGAILHEREGYINFHMENPGFFHSSLNPSDFEKCTNELVQIVEEKLDNFSRIKMKMKTKNETIFGFNESEGLENEFYKAKMKHLKQDSIEWSKRYIQNEESFQCNYPEKIPVPKKKPQLPPPQEKEKKKEWVKYLKSNKC